MAPPFLSDKNINRLRFMLRDIVPENKWGNLRYDLKNEAIKWYRNTDQIVDHIGGLPNLNRKFIKYVLANNAMMDYDPQNYNDPNVGEVSSWISNDARLYPDNPMYSRDTKAFSKSMIKKNHHAKDRTTAQLAQDVKLGDLNVAEFLTPEQMSSMKGDIFRGKLSKKKYMERSHNHSEYHRVCEEDYNDNVPRALFELNPNTTTGTTFAEQYYYNPKYRYRPEFDSNGKPFMYDSTTDKFAAINGLHTRKTVSMLDCDKGKICRSFREADPYEAKMVRRYEDTNPIMFEHWGNKNQEYEERISQLDAQSYVPNNMGSQLGKDATEEERLEKLYGFNNLINGVRPGKLLSDLYRQEMPLYKKGRDGLAKYNPHNAPKFLREKLTYTRPEIINDVEYKRELLHRIKSDYAHNYEPVAVLVPSFNDRLRAVNMRHNGLKNLVTGHR